MKFIFLSFLLILSCAEHHSKIEPVVVPTIKTYVSRCPDSIVVKKEAPDWDAFDQSMIVRMNEGCQRHFSSKHCAKKIVKSSDKEYIIKITNL